MLFDGADKRSVEDAIANTRPAPLSAIRPGLPEGLQAVVRLSPELVILDMGLPDLDGSELLKMIRAVSDVPIIVAVNKNSKAPIFQVADVGIVGDLLDFVPVLTEKIQESK